MIAGAAGSSFSEDFKLPASDSTEAFELLEDEFPAQSGDTATIAFKASNGVRSPAVRTTMEGLFARAEKLPHVSEVASPYESGGAAAISDDGKIAYATVQYDVLANEIEKGDTKKLIADAEGRERRRSPGRPRRPADRGSAAGRRRRPLLPDRSLGGGDRAAADLRLAGRHGPADPHGALRPRRRPQPDHPRHPRLQHRELRAAARPDDRPRGGNRLRPLHPLPLPQRSRRRAGEARGGDRRRRHRRPRRALRRGDGDHRPDGDVPARTLLPLRGGDGGGARRADDDDRRPDPAAGAARDRRPLGRSAAHPRPRQAHAVDRRGHPLVPLEPSDPAPPPARGAALRRPAARALHPHPLAAPRLQRRRHRPGGDDDPRCLRPARRRLRGRLQRPLLDRRLAAVQGRRHRAQGAQQVAEDRTRRRRNHGGDPQPGGQHRRLPALPRPPRRRAKRRPNCSTTSAAI